MSGIIIAGGGLAGAAAACALAQAGGDVTVIERETTPRDKICGEFLSIEAQNYLARLGLDLGALGGHRITHLRLVRGARAITVRLPFQGLGLSRKTLDEALLRHAAAQGATVRRGHVIRRIEGAAIEVEGLGTLRPAALLLATGKHDLRGLRRPTTAPGIGFKMYFNLAAPQQAALARHVELIMFKGGYAGLQMVDRNRANLCLLTSPARLQQAGGKWENLLADLCASSAHLAQRLTGATQLLDAPLTIARVPYGFIHAGAGDPPNLFRLGDQAAVIQSFTGDGMAIALHSAALAVQALHANHPSSTYHQRLARDAAPQIRRAGSIYRIINQPLAQTPIFAAARLWPGALAMAAALTRIPQSKQALLF